MKSSSPKPVRIQRRRSRGWNAHATAANGLPIEYVHRPLHWRNPYKGPPTADGRRAATLAYAIALRDGRLLDPDGNPITEAEIREDLEGMNIACFCPVDHWCHGEVLLRIAAGATVTEIIDELRGYSADRPIDPPALGLGDPARGQGH